MYSIIKNEKPLKTNFTPNRFFINLFLHIKCIGATLQKQGKEIDL